MTPQEDLEETVARDIDSHENTYAFTNDDHKPIDVNEKLNDESHVVNADKDSDECVLSETITEALKLSHIYYIFLEFTLLFSDCVWAKAEVGLLIYDVSSFLRVL